MTIVTRLCVDHLRLSRVQREQYIGMWLPEPLVQSTEQDDPAHIIELHETISTAFMVLLESLAPLDRAVFLLHEVFNYTFTEIAAIVDRTPDDCRQIGHRARQRLRSDRPRFDVKVEAVEQIVREFLIACTDGDLTGLLALLDADVIVSNDSGGKTRAVRNTIVGADRAARLFVGLFHRWGAHLRVRVAMINGQPAMVTYVHDHPACVTHFDIRNGKIQAIYQVLNPEKLTRLNRSARATDKSQ
jgi:RNA polymerase sigma-70 factor (ECF subfamily)